VALQAAAVMLPRQGPDYESARAAYIQRFPDAQEIFELSDFFIVALQPTSARLVAGFGQASSLVGEALDEWLRQ
jgi:putative heme iron utilization protein